MINESGEMIQIPAISVKAVDTTGAGDCFTGALACSLAEGNDLAVAMNFATKASAFSVMYPGAQLSYPTAYHLKTFHEH